MARAHAGLAAAIEAGADLLAAAYTEIGRRAEVGERARLYADDAYTLLRLERPGDGLVRLEQGKTRLLSEALALAALDLTMLAEADQEAMRSARQAVRELEAEMRLPADTPARRSDRELAEALRQARADLNRRIASIRAERPEFMPTGLDLPGLLDLIPEGGALVAPLFTSAAPSARRLSRRRSRGRSASRSDLYQLHAPDPPWLEDSVGAPLICPREIRQALELVSIDELRRAQRIVADRLRLQIATILDRSSREEVLACEKRRPSSPGTRLPPAATSPLRALARVAHRHGQLCQFLVSRSRLLARSPVMVLNSFSVLLRWRISKRTRARTACWTEDLKDCPDASLEPCD